MSTIQTPWLLVQHSAQDRLTKELLLVGCSALIVSIWLCGSGSLHKAASSSGFNFKWDLKPLECFSPAGMWLSLVALCDVKTLYLSTVLWGLIMVVTGQRTSLWGWVKCPFLHQAGLSYFKLTYLSVQMLWYPDGKSSTSRKSWEWCSFGFLKQLFKLRRCVMTGFMQSVLALKLSLQPFPDRMWWKKTCQ